MSGRIVHLPKPKTDVGHVCEPPHAVPGQRPDPSFPSCHLGLPQSDWESGTVWECGCGRRWVTRCSRWHPERRFARWLRERERRHTDSVNGAVVLGAVHADPDHLPPPAIIATPPTEPAQPPTVPTVSPEPWTPPPCPPCGAAPDINWVDVGSYVDPDARIPGTLTCPNPQCPAKTGHAFIIDQRGHTQ